MPADSRRDARRLDQARSRDSPEHSTAFITSHRESLEEFSGGALMALHFTVPTPHDAARGHDRSDGHAGYSSALVGSRLSPADPGIGTCLLAWRRRRGYPRFVCDLHVTGPSTTTIADGRARVVADPWEWRLFDADGSRIVSILGWR